MIDEIARIARLPNIAESEGFQDSILAVFGSAGDVGNCLLTT